MARFYSNENFPYPVVIQLRAHGHDVLTTLDAGHEGNAIHSTSDPEVLALASRDRRAVLTHNREDFRKLHKSNPSHSGLIICKENLDFHRAAELVHNAVTECLERYGTLECKLIKVGKLNFRIEG